MRVARDEKHELTVAAFVDEGSSGWTLDWQAAEDKRPGGEADVLGCRTPAHPNTLDALNLPETAPTEAWLEASPVQDLPRRFQGSKLDAGTAGEKPGFHRRTSEPRWQIGRL